MLWSLICCAQQLLERANIKKLFLLENKLIGKNRMFDGASKFLSSFYC